MSPIARYGEWRPLAPNWNDQPLMRAHDIICLHTMVGSLAGTEAYFRQNGYGGVESHFGVGADGDVYQWQDTRYQAEANYQGNNRLISIETEDRDRFGRFPAWTGSAVPAWTPMQVHALARLIASLCQTHNIPCQLIPDSKPDRRGIGYHRQGIEPWRVPGGETWSKVTGKVCPGDKRIAQIPAIIAAAQRIITSPPKDDDVPLTEAEIDKIADRVWERLRKNTFGDKVGPWQALAAADQRTAELTALVKKLTDGK